MELTSEAAWREWRQFRILSRGRVRAMLDAALFSRDVDPVQFALWVGALVTAVPFVFAVQQTFAYSLLRLSPPATVELVVFGDRLFFVVYSMIAAALVTALTWEALFPSNDDLDAIGPLPVRPRTIAAAYLGAAVVAGTVFCVATALPGAVMFALVTGTQAGLRAVPRSLAGHLIATVAASVFVLLSMLGLRGALAVVGPRLSLRLGTLLQLLTIVSLAAVLFFLPGVLDTLAPAMLLDRDAPAAAAPALWFTALFSTIAGNSRPHLAIEARTGLLALTAAAFVVVPVYLGPARWVRLRALEMRDRARASGLTSAASVVARVALQSPASRAIFVFVVASLSRSRRHVLILSTYLGFAGAIVLITMLATIVRHGNSLARPAVSLVSLSLVLMFFLVLGLRAAFAVPTTIDANWPFRLADPGARRATSATRAALLLLGVAPPLVVMLSLATAVGWSVDDVARLVGMQAAAGILLVECALYTWARLPFVCEHAADPETIRSRWIVAIVLVVLFAHGGAACQVAALRSSPWLAWVLAGYSGAAGAVYLSRRRTDRTIPLRFDDDRPAFETLNLSEALK